MPGCRDMIARRIHSANCSWPTSTPFSCIFWRTGAVGMVMTTRANDGSCGKRERPAKSAERLCVLQHSQRETTQTTAAWPSCAVPTCICTCEQSHASVRVSNPSRAVLVPHPSYSLCWIQECLILPVITVHVCTCEEGFLLSLRNSIAINTSTLFHFTGNTKYQSCSCVDKLLSSSAACCHFRSLWLLSCHPENVSPDGNSALSLPWIILTFSITCKKSILFYSCILGDV